MLGQSYCDGLAARTSEFTQGHPAMPGGLNLPLLLMCHALSQAFGMRSYLKRMAGNLS